MLSILAALARWRFSSPLVMVGTVDNISVDVGARWAWDRGDRVVDIGNRCATAVAPSTVLAT